jgi:hypothetical protein
MWVPNQVNQQVVVDQGLQAQQFSYGGVFPHPPAWVGCVLIEWGLAHALVEMHAVSTRENIACDL